MTDIILNQQTPGGVLQQLADLAGGLTFDQYAPGGVVWQLYLLSGLEDPLDQYAPGGPIHQIEVELEALADSGGGGGGEHVANGGFDDATGWTLSRSSIADGVLVMNGGDVSPPFAQVTSALEITEGVYNFSFDVTGASSGTAFRVRVGGFYASNMDVSGGGTITGRVNVTGAPSDQFIRLSSGDETFTGTFDNFSVVRAGVLGENLIPNGDFTSAAGWDLLNGATIAGGVAAFDGAANSRVTREDLVGVTEGDYLLSVDMLQTSDAEIFVTAGGGTFTVSTGFPPGTFAQTVTILSPGVSASLIILDAGGITSLDNFSLKKFP